MANISTLSGVIAFANQSEKSVVFDSPMPNTDYRVLFSVDDFVFARVKNRTTTGFVVELSTAFTGSLCTILSCDSTCISLTHFIFSG